MAQTPQSAVEQLPVLLDSQTMTPNSPHYLLFSEASRSDRPVQTWRFVLQNVETQRRFCATDSEQAECSERLELLAVVRGLEALDGPARVTLVTKSRYVSRGLKSGLAEWRTNAWSWERFGRIVPVRDRDLWQRVDRALQYHTVDCQSWHFDDQATDDTLAVASPTRQRKDSGRVPKPQMRQPERLQRSARTIDTVWANVKTWVHTIARPALGSTPPLISG